MLPKKFAAVTLPVNDPNPLESMLPPVTLPDKLALVPVITPPTVEAAVCVPVTLTLEPVITPPTVEAAVCVPVTLVLVPVITPPATEAAVTPPDTDTLVPVTLVTLRLPTVALPVALSVPVMLAPVVVTTNTLVPLGARLTLPEAAVINDKGPVSTMLPVTVKLSLDTLPVTLTLAPVITPPTVLAAV